MFARSRPKKSVLPPPSKKRKTTSSVQEISFDETARQEYLTGFCRRKQERIRHAQEQAAKQARREKLDARKQARDERRLEVQENVETVNRMLRESGAVAALPSDEPGPEPEPEPEWDGFPDKPRLEIVDHEQEYIDEDRYTTVTVESVSVSRQGLSRPQGDDADEADDVEAARPSGDVEEARKRGARPAKKRKKTFRYENKIERQLTNSRQRAKSFRRK